MIKYHFTDSECWDQVSVRINWGLMLQKIKWKDFNETRMLIGSAILLFFLTGLFLQAPAYAESCEKVVHAVNMRLSAAEHRARS